MLKDWWMLNQEEKSKIKELEEKFKELLQKVTENELFLFSILTGRIEVAKVFWKKGKVKAFKIFVLLF